MFPEGLSGGGVVTLLLDCKYRIVKSLRGLVTAGFSK